MTLPATQPAIEYTGPNEVRLNPAKPLPEIGPHHIVLAVEACGICFSDTKLLHTFDRHPRKSAVTRVVGGPVTPAAELAQALAEQPGYAPGGLPVTPGHECVARIAAVGAAVTRHSVGERVLVQTDYRHLPTAASVAAFGYTIDGGLERYAVLDERLVIDPQTGERFLIPVDERTTAAGVALIEPWACVECAYAWPERQGPLPGGRRLVVADPGHAPTGVDGWGVPVVAAADVTRVEGLYDDIAYCGADADVIEALGPHLAPQGLFALALGGAAVARPVQLDVGRIHYDQTRYTATAGPDLAAAYARIPAVTELRPGEKVAIIGAAGPMGLMHTVRAAVAGIAGLEIEAVDVDNARLARLAAVVDPLAQAHGVPCRCHNSTAEPLTGPYSYIAVLVPAPALLAQAVSLAGDGAIVNAFAGFPVGTVAALDLNHVARHGVYLVGTSGSRIPDMRAVLAKVESGRLDTTVSLDAVTGLGGVADALAAVDNRTSGGKIMVYPGIADLPLTRLAELPERYPAVAAAMAGGRWTTAAEAALADVTGTATTSVTAVAGAE
ncbi:MAG: alcohol dehydrogenase catalytic domain-containing protein [Propionibacteriaceae bacterium]|jgi:threonine dehydrogenase-like Zn-dependent dehydrogenase|nr:alcohol dehydrogenase catalytic domain-containing protein [Propionibacteriaceae bacterium]